jgi:DNA-binding NtrC family response regulator
MTSIITKEYPTKVIVCTGYGGTHKEAFSRGASAYVIKPFRIDAFFEVVYKVMVEDATCLLLKVGAGAEEYVKLSQNDV